MLSTIGVQNPPEKSKNPLKERVFSMEARGFEPLSEANATPASTGVVTVLMSPERRPVTGFALGQPDCLLQHTPGGDVTAYPTTVEPLSRHMGDGE